MRTIVFILLCCPYLLYSQDILSDEKLIEKKHDLLQDIEDLEEWYQESRESYSELYSSNTSLTDEDIDLRLDHLYYEYYDELEEILGSIQVINTYLILIKIQKEEIFYENKIPLDTLDWSSSGGLNVECDTFGMEKWWDNWMWEGVEPGEADFYENWYVIFNIVSDLDIYLPIIIDHCNYDKINNVMKCGNQEIKIGEEYIIKNISTEPGERGNGILFITEDIEER